MAIHRVLDKVEQVFAVFLEGVAMVWMFFLEWIPCVLGFARQLIGWRKSLMTS
jgi:hypothetical protein